MEMVKWNKRYNSLDVNPRTTKRIGDKNMDTIKINLQEQCLWYFWYNILSSRFPFASKSWVVNEVNKIVYKK